MDIICELMRLKRENVKDYIDFHNNTWPELIKILRDAGFIEEYIYILDTLVIVIMKCENFRIALAKAEKSEVFMKWRAIVKKWIVSDELFFHTKEIFLNLQPVWRLDSFDRDGFLK
ncbi:MAG: L-rhamnose mutarotase [Actinobacteria bacterium]|nr:L-rhamnose mutarotase [Actinomycetota bacterium]